MSRAFSLAGFEVTLIGRFWVTTEVSNGSFLSLGFQCFQQFEESAFAQELTPMN